MREGPSGDDEFGRVPESPSGVRVGPASDGPEFGRVPGSPSGVRDGPLLSGVDRGSGDGVLVRPLSSERLGVLLSPAGGRVEPASPCGVLASGPTRVPNGSSGVEPRSFAVGDGLCCVERGPSLPGEVSRLGVLSGVVLLDDGLLDDGLLPDGELEEGLLPEGLAEEGELPEGLLLDEGLLLLDGELSLLRDELSLLFDASEPWLLPDESALLPCPAALSNPPRA
ncbi:hypothetical protein GCM10009664_49210 [Kitasatospora gansuensis]